MSVKKDFSGRVVIVTGSSSGIGAVTAEEFAKAGAQVVITGRRANNLSEVGEKCRKASPKGLNPLVIVGDVTKEEDCKRLIDSTIVEFGRLDVLVNNAGTGAVTSVFDPNILQNFDGLINLNLRAVVHLTHLSVEHLVKTKGNIVNISSVAGMKPIPELGIYSVAKSGLEMFTKCTALELGPKGIRVNVISPAAVRSNFDVTRKIGNISYDDMMTQSGKSYPLGRVGASIDIANAVLFLASDDCSWITGINFLADGGGIYSPIPKITSD